MNDALALAFYDALASVLRRLAPGLYRVTDQLRDAAHPPQGVELRAADDALYTGIVVVEKNRPVLMLAVRVGERRVEVERRPFVTPAPEPRPPFYGGQRSLPIDPEDPRWDYPDPYAARR